MTLKRADATEGRTVKRMFILAGKKETFLTGSPIGLTPLGDRLFNIYLANRPLADFDSNRVPAVQGISSTVILAPMEEYPVYLPAITSLYANAAPQPSPTDAVHIAPPTATESHTP